MGKYLREIFLAILFSLPCILSASPIASNQASIGPVASINAQSQNFSPENNNSHSPEFDKQWAISKIMADQAWSITSGRPDIYIAILDTGIDEEHEDLDGQVVDRINFTSSPTTTDIFGHGTHIAGIIAALNNNLGVTGLAYGCRLLNVKVADDDGFCNTSSIAKGIIWSVDHGAKVINTSLYILKGSSELDTAVNYAWNKGAIVVACSGNGVGNKIVYPGYYPQCIAVAGADINDRIPDWSGTGQWVRVAAPAADIISTEPHDKYGTRSGTSMASAYVSGLAGLLFSAIPDTERNARDNQKIRLAIAKSCESTNVTSIGRINAFQALRHNSE